MKTGILEKKTTIYQRINIDYPGLEYDTGYINNFMSMIFGGDKNLVEYMQRLLGYAITGQNKEQCMIIFYGKGSNGKSLLLSIIEELLEIYCVRAEKELFWGRVPQAPSIM